MLPSHVNFIYLKYKILENFTAEDSDKKHTFDEFKEATILFADIAGFTAFSSLHKPE